MITEAFVTKSIIEWLEHNGWSILSYDFPESGTGIALRPNDSRAKNKASIIPDIVAQKDTVGLIIENKDRFYLPDYKKLDLLRSSIEDYFTSLQKIFGGAPPPELLFGAAFPHIATQIERANPSGHLIDFLLTVTSEGDTFVTYNARGISF